MPTWLVHGFRWPRVAVRIHIILQNLEDAAAEWLLAPATQAVVLENFRKIYPEQMKHLPDLRLIEQHDPDDLQTTSQPYAYVCDQVHQVDLSVDVDEIRGQGLKEDQWVAITELRDKIAEGQKVGWFVVVNGDVERWAPPIEYEEDEDVDQARANPRGIQLSPISQRSSAGKAEEEVDGDEKERKPRGLKKWFGDRVRKSKSSKDLRSNPTIKTASTSPPMPDLPPNPSVTPLQAANGKKPVSPTSSEAIQRQMDKMPSRQFSK